MTMRVRGYDGLTISGGVARLHTLYDGVMVAIKGTTRRSDATLAAAQVVIEMNPKEAIDLAKALIATAEKHGQQTRSLAASARKQLSKHTGRG